ncbi:hypothetical protein JYG23_01855 [Sedimentibacter sp. zth1]|uniref:hypothetical protein n=1 Tax=Sedimentibacter sp. zth1 TaxID=2816908 RepID=UPI001A922DE2|nr:hypothetical protein [Sedimentibacter sp. zth1]QSX06231.1 hypothetical protein JYG23_01855 [Sedimentibacter sp. zth1]
MKKGKTIKQLADEIGVSKTAIRNKLNDEIKTKFAIKNGNTLYISSKGESIIKAMFLTKNENQSQTVTEKQSQTKSQTVCEVSDFLKLSSIINVLEDNTKLLQEQLKQKDKQIESLQEQLKIKDRQIENANMSLQASQTLQAKNIQLLTTQSYSKEQQKEVKNKKRFLGKFRK